MRRLRIILGLLATLGGATAWYYFRPERALIDVRVDEPPPGQGEVIAQGAFAPEAHDGAGEASLIQLSDGRQVLRLSSFTTLNGPDVRVYLIGAPDVRSRSALERAGYVDLGPLKGNMGNQNYFLPAGTQVDRYAVAAVWCRRFGVNFTQAVLAIP